MPGGVSRSTIRAETVSSPSPRCSRQTSWQWLRETRRGSSRNLSRTFRRTSKRRRRPVGIGDISNRFIHGSRIFLKQAYAPEFLFLRRQIKWEIWLNASCAPYRPTPNVQDILQLRWRIQESSCSPKRWAYLSVRSWVSAIESRPLLRTSCPKTVGVC